MGGELKHEVDLYTSKYGTSQPQKKTKNKKTKTVTVLEPTKKPNSLHNREL